MLNKTHKIKKLRQELEAGNLYSVAIKRAGIRSSETIHRWRKESYCDRLNKFITIAIERCQERRNDIVEDAQFKRLMEGKAVGSEYEFYLCNRKPDRWKKLKDNTVVVQNTINNEVNQGGNSGTFYGEDAELVSSIRAQLLQEIPPQ